MLRTLWISMVQNVKLTVLQMLPECQSIFECDGSHPEDTEIWEI